MSYINSALPIPAKNCETQAIHNVQSGSTAWKRVGSYQCDEPDYQSNQEHISS